MRPPCRIKRLQLNQVLIIVIVIAENMMPSWTLSVVKIWPVLAQSTQPTAQSEEAAGRRTLLRSSADRMPSWPALRQVPLQCQLQLVKL